MTADRTLTWILRASWLVLPFVTGPALAAALDGRAEPVRTTASVGLWVGWAAVVLAVLVPRVGGLTLLRVVAPAALAAAAAAAVAGEPWGVVGAAVAATIALLPEVGELFVNGSAYGDERRFLLRAPGPLLLGPIPLAWAALVAAVTAGPLLLAAGQLAAGLAALVAGAPVALALGRALHSLAHRWAVLVPAGLVLKDHLAVLDPVLFRRTEVEVLRPAPADTDALDLTVRAPGLALELRLLEKAPLVRVELGRRRGEPGQTARLLFTPTRPGALLAEAARRRIPVG